MENYSLELADYKFNTWDLSTRVIYHIINVFE